MEHVKVMILCGNLISFAEHIEVVRHNWAFSDSEISKRVFINTFKNASLKLFFNMYVSQACNFSLIVGWSPLNVTSSN